MSYRYNVALSFQREDWTEVRESLVKSVGKEVVQKFLDEAEKYEDDSYICLKWVDYNHFFGTYFGQEIRKIVEEGNFPCDFLAVGEEGQRVVDENEEDLSRSDLGVLETIHEYAILPNETYPACLDGIIASLTGVLLLLGLTEKEITDAVTTLDGYDFTRREEAMERYIRLAKEKMDMDDDIGEEALKDIALTAEGYRELRQFLREAAALRKELLDARADTSEDVQLPSVGTVMTDIAYSLGEDIDDEYCQNFGVTDNEDTRYPICLHVGKHIQVKNPECWMYSNSVQDMNGHMPFQYRLAIPSFTVGEKAFIRTGKDNEPVKIVACLLDVPNAEQMLSNKTVGGWFCTDRGNVFVIAERNC